MGLGQRFAKEALRCGRIPLGGEQEVNRLAGFVDRPIEIDRVPARGVGTAALV